MANNSDYLQQLQTEKDNLDTSFVNAIRLISAGKERTSVDAEVALAGKPLRHAASYIRTMGKESYRFGRLQTYKYSLITI